MFIKAKPKKAQKIEKKNAKEEIKIHRFFFQTDDSINESTDEVFH